MANKMKLVVTLRKEVADREEGEDLFAVIKNKMEDRPDVKITGHVTNHFDLEPPT